MSEAKLRQPIVVVLGHVDHGKCLHPEEEVFLPSGEFVEIRSFYSKKLREEVYRGYYRVECRRPVYTIDDRELRTAKTTHSWRVEFEGDLYRVVLEDGLSVRVTPEHPFLTVEGWVKAEDLKKGDCIAVASRAITTSTSTFIEAVKKYVKTLDELDRKGLKIAYYIGGYMAGGGIRDLEEGLDILPSSLRGKLRSKYGNLIRQLYRTVNGIPKIVQIAPKEILWKYLEGYIRGYMKGKMPSKVCVRGELKTVKHLKYLLSRVGVEASLSEEDSRLTINLREGVVESLDLNSKIVKDSRSGRVEFLRIDRVEKVPYRGFVYDLTVPPTDNFVANGIVVHNTTLLDKIRGTAVARREPGEITQHVGASIIPSHVIEEVTEPLKKMFKIKLTIPGLLFIDTPGHELFSNLRRRGGSVADFAILVIDVIEGFQPQTYESIEILKQRRVPFLVAANKIDRIPGWKPKPNTPIIESLKRQSEAVKWRLEEQVYKIAGELSKLGFSADRFDRIRDFTRTLAIVPVSAKTGEGIPELLAVLSGLTQQYLKKRLRYAEGPGRGVVLEVKEEPGLGTTIDIILYDGILKRGDIIVVGGLEEAFTTKVRALLLPRPLEEIRAPESKFLQVEEVSAAAGVKISAPNLEKTIAGSPLYVVWDSRELEAYKKKTIEEIMSVRIRTDKDGVIVKADTLGTLEAIVEALKREEIPVRIADVGPISRRDVVEASVSIEKDKTYGVVLGFNVKVLPEVDLEARSLGVKIFTNNVIYKLLEEYLEWAESIKEAEKRAELEAMVRPGKIRIIPGYVFRRSEPIIVGVEVLGGTIKPGYPLITEAGRRIGEIQQIQERGETLREARVGMAVAISIRGRAMVGRHVNEGDVLYTEIPENQVKQWLTKYKSELSEDEMLVLKEYIEVKRRENPFYAIG